MSKFQKLATVATVAVLTTVSAFADPIAVPDMADATGSVTNVFGAVLSVAVLIFGFKKVKSLLKLNYRSFFKSVQIKVILIFFNLTNKKNFTIIQVQNEIRNSNYNGLITHFIGILRQVNPCLFLCVVECGQGIPIIRSFKCFVYGLY